MVSPEFREYYIKYQQRIELNQHVLRITGMLPLWNLGRFLFSFDCHLLPNICLLIVVPSVIFLAIHLMDDNARFINPRITPVCTLHEEVQVIRITVFPFEVCADKILILNKIINESVHDSQILKEQNCRSPDKFTDDRNTKP